MPVFPFIFRIFIKIQTHHKYIFSPLSLINYFHFDISGNFDKLILVNGLY